MSRFTSKRPGIAEINTENQGEMVREMNTLNDAPVSSTDILLLSY